MAGKKIKDQRLQELRRSGYEIADDEPDIRGWQVRNLRGQVLGIVDELLFDVQSCKVRYLVLSIKGKPLNIVSRKVLVPIGLAELHEESDDVLLPDVTVGHLASLPAYNKTRFTSAREKATRNVFAGMEAAEVDDADTANKEEDFYDHEYFDENRMYKRRRYKNEIAMPEETGGIRIKKNITNEPAKEDVRLKQDDVTTENNAANKLMQKDDFAPFHESTIELTEHAEVPVVTKEARVVEEVSVGKDAQLRNETIHDTVRKTEVEIEELKKEDLSKQTNSGDI